MEGPWRDAMIGDARLPPVDRQYVTARRSRARTSTPTSRSANARRGYRGPGEMRIRAHDLAAGPLQHDRVQASADDGKVLAECDAPEGLTVGPMRVVDEGRS